MRTQRALTIVVSAIALTWFVTSAWAVFHYYVMLPGMRQVLMNNPAVSAHYFGGISPELKNRLEANRAFGTFLFPNALGAFTALGIPLLLAASVRGVKRMLSSEIPDAPAHPWTNWFTIAVFFSFTTVVLIVLYFGNDFIGTARPDGAAPIGGTYRPFAVFLIPAAGIGFAAAWVTSRRGLFRLGEVVAGIGAPAALFFSLFALWLSYSRGAMVALAGAAVLSVWILWGGRLPFGAKRAVAMLLIGMHVLAVPASRAQEEVDGYLVPEPLPTRFEYTWVQYVKNLESLGELDIEGRQRSLSDLGKLDSFNARVTYWQVGLRMARANLWTGVGLDNFRQGYLQYQFLGASDVEAAHNDFLQYFCETGLFGGGLFLAFWVYFGVWGARRILREDDLNARRWLIGIYAGTIAFAVNSLVDFNFQNPSIAELAMIVAGVFYAQARQTEPDDAAPEWTSTRVIRGIGVALTVLTIVLTATVARV